MNAILKAKLKQFTICPNWWRMYLWGGGHTHETDPTQHGWLARRLPDRDKSFEFVLVGRKGLPGCFSARQLFGGDIDVAIYTDETPEQVLELWKTGESTARFDPIYRQFPNIPGWGLEVLDVLAKYQREELEYVRGGRYDQD